MKWLSWVSVLILALSSLFNLSMAPLAGARPPIPLPPSPRESTRWDSLDLEHHPDYTPPAKRAPLAAAVADSSVYTQEGMWYWGRTALQTWVDGNWEIYQGDGDGVIQTRLTRNHLPDLSPRMSADGNKVVYLEYTHDTFEIFTVRYQQSITRLTRLQGQNDTPDWSADGTKIWFASTRAGNWDIWRMNEDGSDPQRITNSPLDEWNPVEAPDGSRLAFFRRSLNSTENADLWVAPFDGSGAYPVATGLRNATALSWSVDGSLLYFSYDQNGDDGLDSASLRAFDGANLHTFKTTESQYEDLWTVGELPTGCEFAFMQIYYLVIKGKVYYGEFRLHRIPLDRPGCPATGGAAAQPAQYRAGEDVNVPNWVHQWVSMDRLPPKTGARVSDYSRASGYQVAIDLSDPGYSGIRDFQLQRRVDGGAWTDFGFIPQFQYHETGLPGQLVEYRTGATDLARNTEPLGEAEDVTRLYSFRITGQVTDNRGRPLENAAINLSGPAWGPVISDPNGRYDAYLTGSGSYTVGGQLDLYGAPDPVDLTVGPDRAYSFYLPPADNILANGGFEGGLDGWTALGDLGASVSADNRHAGVTGLGIGQSCPPPCVNAVEEIPLDAEVNDDPKYKIRAEIDPNGNIYVLYPKKTDQTYNYETVYTVEMIIRGADGSWSTPEEIGVEDPPTGGKKVMDMAIDASGGQHIVWGVDGLEYFDGRPQPKIYYRYRSPEGQWADQEIANPFGYAPKIFLAPDGTPHILYYDYFSRLVEHIWRMSNGVWTPPVSICGTEGSAVCAQSRQYTALVDGQGTLHVLWSVAPTDYREKKGIYHRTLTYENELGPLEVLKSIVPPEVEQIRSWSAGVDAAGTIHLLYEDWRYENRTEYSSLRYLMLDPETGWTPEYEFNIPYTHVTDFLFDHDGNSLFFLSGLNNATSGAILKRDALGNWLSIYNLPSGGVEAVQDATGKVHEILNPFWYNPNRSPAYECFNHGSCGPLGYLSNLVLGPGSRGEISRQVTIPADLHKPTLAAMYRFSGPQRLVDSRFFISVDNGSGPVEAAVVHEASEHWRVLSADLSPWAGQTVTIHLGMQQEAGDPQMQLQLDDISLGSWITPQVTSIDPDFRHYPVIAPFVMTIHGDNFHNPTVTVGSATYSPEVVDEQTLRVTVLPEAIPTPGDYDVWVTNEDGTRGGLARALRSPSPLYFPLLGNP